MEESFTPTLYIKENKEIIRKREFQKDSDIFVKEGDIVKNNQVISKVLKAGELALEKIAESVSLEPNDIKDNYTVKVGDKVEKGSLLLSKKGLFNLFNVSYYSKHEGKIEFISKETGVVGIRQKSIEFSLKSYLEGIVSKIGDYFIEIKSNASIIQGVFGVGGEKECMLKKLDMTSFENEKEENNIAYFYNGSPSIDILKKICSKAKALIVPSIKSNVLKEFLGYEISIPITGNENISTTIVITEGFGDIAFSPKIINLLEESEGCSVSLNGTTQIRAGAIRPEVIIYKKENEKTGKNKEEEKLVRVLRDPYFGKIGKLISFIKEDYEFENEVKARAAKIIIDGKEVVVPKANIEIL